EQDVALDATGLEIGLDAEHRVRPLRIAADLAAAEPSVARNVEVGEAEDHAARGVLDCVREGITAPAVACVQSHIAAGPAIDRDRPQTGAGGGWILARLSAAAAGPANAASAITIHLRIPNPKRPLRGEDYHAGRERL